MKVLIENGRIYPMDAPMIPEGYIIIEDGRFAQVGAMAHCPEWSGARIDAAGCIILPGLVDAHSHIGLFNEGLRFEGEDGNEDTDPITPQLRALDAVYPQDAAFAEARAAGVTTVVTGPGSANPIGGQFIAMKTQGICVDDMLLSPCAAMKFALGENPKMTYNQKDRAPVTRMGSAALIREALRKAREYQEQRDDPESDCDFDMKYEALLPLLSGEIGAQIHCHRADDIFTALRIVREFGLRAALVHATEGYLVADRLAKENIPVIAGPIMTTRTKPELARQSVTQAARLIAAGVPVAICTDYPEVPQDYLMLSAALAAREGLSDEQAFAAVTIEPARIIGLAHRIGSITPGKDADLVMYDGHPFDTRTRVREVWINGERNVEHA